VHRPHLRGPLTDPKTLHGAPARHRLRKRAESRQVIVPVALSTLVIGSIALQTQSKQNVLDNLSEGSLHSRNSSSSDFHQGPLHVCFVKKWCRPVNPHTNSLSPKGRLNRQRLRAKTKKHGYPIGCDALLDKALDGGRNIASFCLVSASNVTMNGLGRAPLRFEFRAPGRPSMMWLAARTMCSPER
jgi:hypothetical protein